MTFLDHLQCRVKYWNKQQMLPEHFLGIRKGLNLGFKAGIQLQNKNHTEDWALGRLLEGGAYSKTLLLTDG